jgi:hypothetical protein
MASGPRGFTVNAARSDYESPVPQYGTDLETITGNHGESRAQNNPIAIKRSTLVPE